jgi:hypothetical protein
MKKFIDQVSELVLGLRNRGYLKQAEVLEDKFFEYKTAQTHLYKVFNEEGEDVVDRAHPDGDIEMGEACCGHGCVETQTSQHKKILDIVKKNPTGKFASKDVRLVTISSGLLKYLFAIAEKYGLDQVKIMANSAWKNGPFQCSTRDISDMLYELESLQGEFDWDLFSEGFKVEGTDDEYLEESFDDIEEVEPVLTMKDFAEEDRCKLLLKMAEEVLQPQQIQGPAPLTSKQVEEVIAYGESSEFYPQYSQIISKIATEINAGADKIEIEKKRVDSTAFLNVFLETKKSIQDPSSISSGLAEAIKISTGIDVPGMRRWLVQNPDSGSSIIDVKNYGGEHERDKHDRYVGEIRAAIGHYIQKRNDAEKALGKFYNQQLNQIKESIKAISPTVDQKIVSNYTILQKVMELKGTSKVTYPYSEVEQLYNCSVGKTAEQYINGNIQQYLDQIYQTISNIPISVDVVEDANAKIGDVLYNKAEIAGLSKNYKFLSSNLLQASKKIGEKDKYAGNIKMFLGLGQVLDKFEGSHPQELFNYLKSSGFLDQKDSKGNLYFDIQGPADLYKLNGYLQSYQAFVSNLAPTQTTAQTSNLRLIKESQGMPAAPPTALKPPVDKPAAGAPVGKPAAGKPTAGTGRIVVKQEERDSVMKMQFLMTELASVIYNNNASAISPENSKTKAEVMFGLEKSKLDSYAAKLQIVNTERTITAGSIGDGLWGQKTANGLKVIEELIKAYTAVKENETKINGTIFNGSPYYVNKPDTAAKAHENSKIIMELKAVVAGSIKPKKVDKDFGNVPFYAEKTHKGDFPMKMSDVESLSSFLNFLEKNNVASAAGASLREGETLKTEYDAKSGKTTQTPYSVPPVK